LSWSATLKPPKKSNQTDKNVRSSASNAFKISILSLASWQSIALRFNLHGNALIGRIFFLRFQGIQAGWLRCLRQI
jgi:hypothetical protein